MLIAHTLKQSHHDRFLWLNLLVLELALQHFLGKGGHFQFLFSKRLTNLCPRLRGDRNTEPVTFGQLFGRSENLHLVATLKVSAYGHILLVDLATCTV